eukprot:gene6532-10539_t
MSYNECNVVMIQGSQMMMSGFTGDCAPRAVFPRRTTGTVVSLGGDVNSVTSIFEASTLSNSEVSEVAGSKISDYLSDLLYKKSVIENTSFLEKEHLTDIKHCVCYVALDAKIEEKKQIMKQYDMDSITLKLGNEVFQCTEPLFNPKLIGSNSTPIQQMIWDCITTKPSDIQSEASPNLRQNGSFCNISKVSKNKACP